MKMMSMRRAAICVAAVVASARASLAQASADIRARQSAARDSIVEGNKRWAAARISADRAAFERMLAPDFYAQFPNRRATRDEFIQSIATAAPDSKLLRFTPSVLTLSILPTGADAIIEEKLEIEHPGPDGNPVRDYQLWITRDRWRAVEGVWKIASTEALGMEWWRGTRPPIANW